MFMDLDLLIVKHEYQRPIYLFMILSLVCQRLLLIVSMFSWLLLLVMFQKLF